MLVLLLEPLASFCWPHKFLGSSPVADQMAASEISLFQPSSDPSFIPTLFIHLVHISITTFSIVGDIHVPTNLEDPRCHQDTFLYPLAITQRLPHGRPEWTDVHSKHLLLHVEWNLDRNLKRRKNSMKSTELLGFFFPVRYGLYE